MAVAEKVFKVRGQRSRSQREQMHFAAEAYISTVWRRRSLVKKLTVKSVQFEMLNLAVPVLVVL